MMAAASSGRGQPDAARQAALIEDINDKLILEQAILTSLLDLEQEPTIGKEVDRTRDRMRVLKKQLVDAQRALPPDSFSGNGSSPGSEGSFASNHLSSSRRSTNMPSPGADALGAHESASRKRSLSNHLEGSGEIRRDVKLPRSSWGAASLPLRSPTSRKRDDFASSSPGVIDLTGDDGDCQSLLSRQRQEMDRLARAKRMAEEDAKLAIQLQEQDDSADLYPALVPASRTAFDQILPRQSQGVSTSSSQGSNSQTPAMEQPGLASNSNPQLQTALQPLTRSPKPYQQSFPSKSKMPGTYADEDWSDGDDKDGLVILDRPPPHMFPGSSTPSRPSLTHIPTYPAYSRAAYGSQAPLNHAPGVSAAELARRAALARQQGYITPQQLAVAGQGFSSTPWPSAAVPPGFHRVRPGSLAGGSFNPIYDTYLNARPTPQQARGQVNLGNVIRQTAQYDYVNRTDAYGNPLNAHLASALESIERAQHDSRSTDEEIKKLLSNISPELDFTEEERNSSPEELKCPLYRHQQIALKWMQDIEARGKDGKGSGGAILADDMGLGKTISTLALMLTRPSPDNIKTNLIVGPVALVRQWQSEIKRKVRSVHSLSIFLYHGASKRRADFAYLRKFDVVLTTYGTLAQEWRKFNDYQEAHPDEDLEANAELHRKCPLLHPKSKFYRVILDEAQYIKNQNAQCSKGATRLNSSYRWCLTGTPMQNGIDELYSLMRFLRIKPYDDHKIFKRTFGTLTPSRAAKNASTFQQEGSMQQLRVVLKAIMLRRMKNTMIDGKPIVQLPPKTEQSETVEFNDDERSFYKDLEERSQVVFNKYLRAGTVGKNYSNILVLLLRLRQACCHPHLNMDVEAVGGVASGDNMEELAKTLDAAVISRIKAIEAFECPLCYDAVADPALVLPCGHDCCADCLTRHLDTVARNRIQEGEAPGSANCFLCRQPITPDKVINYSTFKKVHMPAEDDEAGEAIAPEMDLSDSSSEYDSDSDSDMDGSGDEVDKYGDLRGFIVPDEEIDDDTDAANVSEEMDKKPKMGAKKSRAKKEKKVRSGGGSGGESKGKAKADEVKPEMLKTLRMEASKNKEARRRYMHYLKKNWEPSAKVTKCMELVAEIQKTGEKTIIFSQWTALLDLLEIPIRYHHRIKYQRYDGGMSAAQRDDAVRAFIDDPRVKVLLVSLRAGNAGLNLTAASHVIICDPFWNPYVEMQAVDRAHRIGQQRPVKVHRILVEGTVEDRIVELQEKKRALVDTALDEEGGRQIARLSTRELGFLFGLGRP